MFKFGFLCLLPAAILLEMSGCSKTQDAAYGQTQLAQIQDTGAASDGNLAPVNQQPPEQAQQPAQGYDTAPEEPDYSGQEVYASEPPPPLPEYSQPPVPGDDYIWTPGYWSYANAGYYWVPGAWVLAPYVDALWTPPYWDFFGGRYRWHRGYWGRYIGFYGGINYGFGYTGRGYYGGFWNGGRFSYNRAVTNVTINVHNVYNRGVSNFTPANRVSYNGGRGGISVRPAPAELAAFRGTRTAPVTAQIDHARAAAGNRSQFASANGGRPALVAQAQPLSTPYRTPASRPAVAEPSRAPGRSIEPSQVRQGQPEARPAQNERLQAPPQNQRPEVNRPVPAPRPVAPQQPRPAQQPALRQPEPPPQRIAPEQQRAERPERPAPEARRAQQPPAPQPQAVRPEPQPRPQQAPRPAPEARPAPPPAARQQQPSRQGPPPGRGDDRDRR
jgi:hypothetical protein